MLVYIVQVRCDVTSVPEGAPCHNCKFAGTECIVRSTVSPEARLDSCLRGSRSRRAIVKGDWKVLTVYLFCNVNQLYFLGDGRNQTTQNIMEAWKSWHQLRFRQTSILLIQINQNIKPFKTNLFHIPLAMEAKFQTPTV